MDGASITYATFKDWLDIMKNRSKVRMHELIERLGLRAKWSSNKRGKTNFESALVRELVADMGDVVSTLPKEPDELMNLLSKEGSLKDEVDGLLEKHGAKIWGRVGDREHLITANEPGVEEGLYPRDLYFENAEDRELIHKLIHWWIGLKACNVILARERLDRERRKKAESRQARAEADFSGQQDGGGTPASFVALAPNSVLHDADTGARGSPMSSSAMLTPPEPGESPTTGVREGVGVMTANGGGHAKNSSAPIGTSKTQQLPGMQQPQNIIEGLWKKLGTETSYAHQSVTPASSVHGHHSHLLNNNNNSSNSSSNNSNNNHTKGAATAAAPPPPLSNTNTAAVDRQISVDVAKLVANFGADDAASVEIPQANSSTPYRGLDYDRLRELRQYIYGEANGYQMDEEALLDGLEKTWRETVRADYHRMVENIPVFIARERAILTWIELKRHLAALQRANERWSAEGHTQAEIERRIQQHRTLMGCTQTIIANFEDIGQGFGLGPNVPVDRDELLRQSIMVLVGEKYAAEMDWKPIEFTATMSWLHGHLEDFRRDEEEDGKGMLWYAG